MKKDIPTKSCGGLSEVFVCMRPPKADTHTYKYGTAKETEQMLSNGFCPQPQNNKAMKKSSPYLYIF
jgi:hypothetical protein